MQPGGTFNVRYAQDMAIMRTRTQWALLLLLLLLLGFVPLFVPARWMAFVITTLILIITLHGLNIVLGYAGQISIGHAAFMAVGGFAAALFVVEVGLSFWLALPLAGLVSAVISVFFGAPSLRLKGFYLAMSTLAAHFIILFMINRVDLWIPGFPKLSLGVWDLPRPSVMGLALKGDTNYYYLVLGLAVLMTFFAKNLARTRAGRAFVAVRDNDLAAEAMGINIFSHKLLAFAISGFYAGIAGTLLVFYMGMAHTQYFSLWDAIWFLGMIVVGGMGSTVGPIFGAVFFKIIEEVMTFAGPSIYKAMPFLPPEVASGLAMVIWALVIILFLIFEPRGMSHRWEIFKSSYRLHPWAY